MRRGALGISLLVVTTALGLVACGGVRPRGDAAAPGVARPDVKLVVLDIKHANPAVRDTVVDLLRERYVVVDDGEYRRTARELKARTMRTRHVAKVTRTLGLDAVAYGVLVKRGKKKYALRLTLREGDSGRLLSRFTLPVEDGRIKRGKLRRKLYAALDQVAPDPDEPLPEPEGDEPVADQADGAAQVAEREPERPSKRRRQPEPKAEPAAPAVDEASLTRSLASGSKKSKKPEPRPEPEPAPAKVASKPAPKKPEGKPAAGKPPTKVAEAPDRGTRKRDPAVGELEDKPLPAVEVDEDGQVIDDEVPGALK
jgi:hypothetical protein